MKTKLRSLLIPLSLLLAALAFSSCEDGSSGSAGGVHQMGSPNHPTPMFDKDMPGHSR